jgi:hypothetical protein
MAINELEFSGNVRQRHMKFMFWGNTGTRKTETVLRNFPHVFLIDTEGNSDQCINMEEIPPFMRLQTKDTRKVVEYLDKLAAGQIKFPDGSPVETLAFDTVSVIWGIQQEVAAVNAEKRATGRRDANPEGATMTQIDWVIAKRPMKKIANRINTLPVKYLIYLAREKDPYNENNTGPKLPPVPDAVKGSDYDMNLALHFTNVGGKWGYEVTKVQGALGKMYPMGSKGSKIDFPALFDYAKNLTGTAVVEKDDMDIAAEIVDSENPSAPKPEKTWAEMVKFANANGIATIDIAPILKASGINSFRPTEFDTVKTVLQDFLRSTRAG